MKSQTDLRQTEFIHQELEQLRRRRRVDHLVNHFRHCAICGSPGFVLDLVCQPCALAMSECQNRGLRLCQAGYPFPVFSLFTWTPQTEDVVRPLAYALKGGRRIAGVMKLLQELSFERRSFGEVARPLFVPPPRPSRRREHGWLMAMLLSQIWRTESWDILEKIDSPASLWALLQLGSKSAQKTRTQRERAELRFCLRPEAQNVNDLPAASTVVFADDVITTGASAMAAYMAMEDPKSFEVWTLICRPKLAGITGI